MDIDEGYYEVDTHATAGNQTDDVVPVEPVIPKKVSVPPPDSKKLSRKAPPAPKKKVAKVEKAPDVLQKVSLPPPVPEQVVVAHLAKQKSIKEEEMGVEEEFV